MVSLPASPLTVSESSAPSVPASVTFAASPLTTTAAPLLATVMVSSPAVPLTITLSAAPSPWPLPGVADRSMSTCLTSVPVRSLTVMVSAPPKALTWMCSTPLRSMVMLPTSRNSRTREPLAEMSMFSPTLAPLNTSVSVPAWPSTMSLPSPGFQMNVSLPLPSRATSLPRPPMTVSLPSPPSSVSLPWLPVMVSLPAPPSMVRPMTPAGRPDALIVSLPLPALIVSTSPASASVDADLRGQSGDRDAGAAPRRR